MGRLDDEFDFVASSVERAARLQRRACEKALRDPVVRAPALGRHLVSLYEAIEQQVVVRRCAFKVALDDVVRRDAIVGMRELVWRVRDMQSNLTWLDAAGSATLDLGTTYYVEALARDLVARDVELTVVTTDQFSYATSSEPWRPVIEAWGHGLPPDEPKVVVVMVPRREQRSGLLHPLIVHELGHAVDSEHGTVDQIMSNAVQRQPLNRRFGKASQELAAAQKMPLADAGQLLIERLRYWVAEAFCDAVAVGQLGPTYLYSFLAEVAASSMDEPGPKHPPPRERIALLVDHVDGAGWAPVLAAADADLDGWIRSIVASRPSHKGANGFLVWAVRNLRALIYRHARKALRGSFFGYDEAELAEVRELLDAGIPPAQRSSGEPARAETIMLASWLSALKAVGGGTAALALAPDAPQLASLMPAALELSALTRAWRVT